MHFVHLEAWVVKKSLVAANWQDAANIVCWLRRSMWLSWSPTQTARSSQRWTSLPGLAWSNIGAYISQLHIYEYVRV